MEIGVLYLSHAMLVLAELIVCSTRGLACILAKLFWPTVMSLSLTLIFSKSQNTQTNLVQSSDMETKPTRLPGSRYKIYQLDLLSLSLRMEIGSPEALCIKRADTYFGRRVLA